MKQGFSLVELSIVLVILGLLTGGILGGQALMRAAELRNVTQEFNKYQTAVMTFKDKYSALPGDLTNATDFWGVAHATPATCISTASTGTETCNGDGDGNINPTQTTTAAGSNEMYRIWQHLANAGLIEGTYSGISEGANVYTSIIGTNIPYSKMNEAGWSVRNLGVTGGNANYFGTDYGNALLLGANYPNSFALNPVLTPEEAWNIDTKMDDGVAGQGKIVAMWWDTCTDAADQTDLQADYLLSDSSKRCALYFTHSF